VEHFYMGIDVGKTLCWICVLDDEGEPVYVDAVPTLCRKSWSQMLELFKGSTVEAAFEVGTHYQWMYDLLQEHCAAVVVVAPQRKSHKKTDRLDSAHLARELRVGNLEGIFVPPQWMYKDRRLVARIHALSAQIALVKINMRDLLFTVRLTCPHTDLEGAKAQAWLEQIGLPKLEEQDALVLRQFQEQLALLRKQYDELYKIARTRLKQYPDAQLAGSIPGFGVLVTLGALSAIGRIDRFSSAPQLPAYFGLCGRVDQSSDRMVNGSITRRGSKHVRWLLGQAVTHLVKRDPKARRRYQKLKRKKKPKVARVAMMRWLSTVLWRMLTQQEKYRLNGAKGAYLSKKVA